jgi:hypothetical protein
VLAMIASLAEMASMAPTAGGKKSNVRTACETYTDFVHHYFRSVPLGFGICTAIFPEIAQLHRWYVKKIGIPLEIEF